MDEDWLLRSWSWNDDEGDLGLGEHEGRYLKLFVVDEIGNMKLERPMMLSNVRSKIVIDGRSRENFLRLASDSQPTTTFPSFPKPPQTKLIMSPPIAGGKQKESGKARVLGSATSGIAELALFHPVDTVAKRLMSNKQSSLSVTQIVFKDKATASVGTKLISLFPGLGYAAGE